MNKTTKIILLSLSFVAVTMGGYFAYMYYKLQNAYETTLNEDEANAKIDEVTSDVEDDDILPDEATASANADKGVQADVDEQ